VRSKEQRPVWYYEVCEEGNQILKIGEHSYYLSADGYLMPSKKGQPAPDLRFFKTNP
jgi:hypothetical protein